MDREISTTYPIEVETVQYHLEDNTQTVRTFKWLVTTHFCGGQVSAMFRKLYQDTELSFPPWVGVAMPLHINQSEEIPDSEFFDLTAEDGHVFCFLPLPLDRPIATGLPVHVNGFFALELNRKYLKWPTATQRGDELTDKRLLWNQCLLTEGLPRAYSKLLLDAIDMHAMGRLRDISIRTIYRAFPDIRRVEPKWDVILAPLFAEVFKHRVVFTEARRGMWITPKEAVFSQLDEEADDAQKLIMEVLSQGQVKVACVPPHVQSAIKSCSHVSLQYITPALVSSTFRSIQVIHLVWEVCVGKINSSVLGR